MLLPFYLLFARDFRDASLQHKAATTLVDKVLSVTAILASE